jgi:hypothetical protein
MVVKVTFYPVSDIEVFARRADRFGTLRHAFSGFQIAAWTRARHCVWGGSGDQLHCARPVEIKESYEGTLCCEDDLWKKQNSHEGTPCCVVRMKSCVCLNLTARGLANAPAILRGSPQSACRTPKILKKSSRKHQCSEMEGIHSTTYEK